MSVREWVNNNSAAATAAAVVLLCVALGVIVWNNASGQRGMVGDAYFYDLASDELFLHDLQNHPPVVGPSGERQGVRAYVFACGECPRARDIRGLSAEELEQQTDAFIAYFERWPERARAVLAGEVEPDDEYELMRVQHEGTEIRAVDGDRWVPMESGPGADITARAAERCGPNVQRQFCMP